MILNAESVVSQKIMNSRGHGAAPKHNGSSRTVLQKLIQQELHWAILLIQKWTHTANAWLWN